MDVGFVKSFINVQFTGILKPIARVVEEFAFVVIHSNVASALT
jgi:hypothetical protein